MRAVEVKIEAGRGKVGSGNRYIKLETPTQNQQQTRRISKKEQGPKFLLLIDTRLDCTHQRITIPARRWYYRIGLGWNKV